MCVWKSSAVEGKNCCCSRQIETKRRERERQRGRENACLAFMHLLIYRHLSSYLSMCLFTSSFLCLLFEMKERKRRRRLALERKNDEEAENKREEKEEFPEWRSLMMGCMHMHTLTEEEKFIEKERKETDNAK